jgi:hypothetical protein
MSWRRWVEISSRRERGTTLALLRIALGVVMLKSLASVVRADLVDVLWLPQEHGGLLRNPSALWLVDLLGGPTPRVVWTLVVMALVATLLMTFGAGGRVTVFVAVLLYRSVSTIGSGTGSFDLMIFNAGWLLVLGQPSATLSLDCRLRRGSWTSDRLIAAWPRYLVMFQLVLVYTVTGLHKLSASWTFADGYSALYWVLVDPTFARVDHGWVAWIYPLLQGATAIAWHFEVSAPLLLLVAYYRDTADRPGRLRALFNRHDLRRPWALVGIAMHLGIWALLNLGQFSWISIAYYLALWRPDELEALGARVAARLRQRAVDRQGDGEITRRSRAVFHGSAAIDAADAMTP